MIELPESHVLAQQLQDSLLGKPISRVIAAQSPHGFGWYCGDPADYPALLEGLRVTGAHPNAGQVVLEMEHMRLAFNDGTNLRLLPPGTPPPKKHQLYLQFGDAFALVCTVQMYGGMMAFREGEYQNPYYLVAQEKPTPYTDTFDRAYFQTICDAAKPNLSLKALLATEQRIPGLGNGVLQDILFCAGQHPQSKLQALQADDLDAVYTALKDVLLRMRTGGGRNTEKDLYGNPGGYACILSSKTLGQPCPRCGGVITRKAYLGGNVYVCERCQPLRT